MLEYSDLQSAEDSFRFYIMLGIVVGQKDPRYIDKNINEYKSLLRSKNVSDKNIEFCIHKASITIPTDFLRIYDLQGVYFKERQTFFKQDKALSKNELKKLEKEKEEK